ncbi:orange carotenoid protein N-terminal domain-containing protein [Aliterella atlantica]|uniref:OCP N-terminal domain-containing protein n=1 Tax=Aliterella atlantica CENA595 TaxID=1618023 RepID=A0A0D8ZVK6_9CYAN|nr:orange carotenoid protein N-terminal domain-containing protein [Aliterella atlantica]KJH71256.1 hypothetical protein UH38_13265 [Aliterella atlantica CENA595]
MTSAQSESLQKALSAFRGLRMEDKLTAMALIFQHVAREVPADSIPQSSKVSELVNKVGQLSQELQTDALRDMLDAQRQDGDEVALDPNPSKALGELVTGKNENIPVGDYSSLGKEEKLAFWYQMGQKVSSSGANISPSADVNEVLKSLQSLNQDERISFISKALGR